MGESKSVRAFPLTPLPAYICPSQFILPGPDTRTGATHDQRTVRCYRDDRSGLALGQWAHRSVDSEVSLEHLDPRLLMWNMRRNIDVLALPKSRASVIQFTYPELAKEQRDYWLVAKPGQGVDLCLIDPGHDVDLFIRADLKAMTSAWMGWSSLRREIDAGKIVLIGNNGLVNTLEKWMVRCGYAVPEESKAKAA